MMVAKVGTPPRFRTSTTACPKNGETTGGIMSLSSSGSSVILVRIKLTRPLAPMTSG